MPFYRPPIIDSPFFPFSITPSFCETDKPLLFLPAQTVRPLLFLSCPQHEYVSGLPLCSPLSCSRASSPILRAINTRTCLLTSTPQGWNVQNGASHLPPNLPLPLSSAAQPLNQTRTVAGSCSTSSPSVLSSPHQPFSSVTPASQGIPQLILALHPEECSPCKRRSG